MAGSIPVFPNVPTTPPFGPEPFFPADGGRIAPTMPVLTVEGLSPDANGDVTGLVTYGSYQVLSSSQQATVRLSIGAQETLVSGTNLKTVDGQTLLGPGNVTVSWSGVTGKPASVVNIDALLASKVDKVSGKGLSTEDYTSAEKAKLSGIEAGAQVNPSDYTTVRSDAAAGKSAYDAALAYGDVVTHSASEFASAAQGSKADSALQASDVVDSLASTAADAPLSANAGHTLNGRIDGLSALGRFLSVWNSATGLPATNPPSLPYSYRTGDYYVVGTVGTANLKPEGSSYSGAASTAAEAGAVKPNDIYRYDGTGTWTLVSIADREVAWGSISGTLSDQADLSQALAGKQASLPKTGGAYDISITGTAARATADSSGNVIADTYAPYSWVSVQLSGHDSLATAHSAAFGKKADCKSTTVTTVTCYRHSFSDVGGFPLSLVTIDVTPAGEKSIVVKNSDGTVALTVTDFDVSSSGDFTGSGTTYHAAFDSDIYDGCFIVSTAGGGVSMHVEGVRNITASTQTVSFTDGSALSSASVRTEVTSTTTTYDATVAAKAEKDASGNVIADTYALKDADSVAGRIAVFDANHDPVDSGRSVIETAMTESTTLKVPAASSVFRTCVRAAETDTAGTFSVSFPWFDSQAYPGLAMTFSYGNFAGAGFDTYAVDGICPKAAEAIVSSGAYLRAGYKVNAGTGRLEYYAPNGSEPSQTVAFQSDVSSCVTATTDASSGSHTVVFPWTGGMHPDLAMTFSYGYFAGSACDTYAVDGICPKTTEAIVSSGYSKAGYKVNAGTGRLEYYAPNGSEPSQTVAYLSDVSVRPWIASTAYAVNDHVVYSGTEYVCIAANSDATFAAAKWTAYAKATDLGAKQDKVYTLTPSFTPAAVTLSSSGGATITFDVECSDLVLSDGDWSCTALLSSADPTIEEELTFVTSDGGHTEADASVDFGAHLVSVTHEQVEYTGTLRIQAVRTAAYCGAKADTTPAEGSGRLVTSGGVYGAIGADVTHVKSVSVNNGGLKAETIDASGDLDVSSLFSSDNTSLVGTIDLRVPYDLTDATSSIGASSGTYSLATDSITNIKLIDGADTTAATATINIAAKASGVTTARDILMRLDCSSCTVNPTITWGFSPVTVKDGNTWATIAVPVAGKVYIYTFTELTSGVFFAARRELTA